MMTQPTLTFQSILLYKYTLFFGARKTRAQNKSKEDANINGEITSLLFFTMRSTTALTLKMPLEQKSTLGTLEKKHAL